MSPRIQAAILLLVTIPLVVFAPTTSGPQVTTSTPEAIEGQSHTVLPDGRSLWLGGQGPHGPLDRGFVGDVQGQVLAAVPHALGKARAGHSATVMPDGTVLIAGGHGEHGLVDQLEVFDPLTQVFADARVSGFTARAGHTATVLTDGRLFIAGGVTDTGGPVATAELWELATGVARPVAATMASARHRHRATLLEDGRVLLSAGLDAAGQPLADGEIFDPLSERFEPASLAQISPSSSAPRLSGSVPADGAAEVPIDTIIALRFSTPLQVERVTSDTVSLSDPGRPIAIRVVPVEGGRPEIALRDRLAQDVFRRDVLYR